MKLVIIEIWAPGSELSPQQLMKPGYTFSCVMGVYMSGRVLTGPPAPLVTEEQWFPEGGQGVETVILMDSI